MLFNGLKILVSVVRFRDCPPSFLFNVNELSNLSILTHHNLKWQLCPFFSFCTVLILSFVSWWSSKTFTDAFPGSVSLYLLQPSSYDRDLDSNFFRYTSPNHVTDSGFLMCWKILSCLNEEIRKSFVNWGLTCFNANKFSQVLNYRFLCLWDYANYCLVI